MPCISAAEFRARVSAKKGRREKMKEDETKEDILWPTVVFLTADV